MRIDIVTIFPEFFSVLDVSLLGKARESGLIDLAVHDLRDYTYDRHR
ncbi:MAG TPA: tRNA (guanosine(37)-N1)-methyltransferase TrmD, partial [Microbacteriaceae bacterium]